MHLIKNKIVINNQKSDFLHNFEGGKCKNLAFCAKFKKKKRLPKRRKQNTKFKVRNFETFSTKKVTKFYKNKEI